MFSLFTKKSLSATDHPAIPHPYLPASEITDDELVRFLKGVFSAKRPVISSLLLVALEVFPAQYSIFQRNMRKSNQYAKSMNGMIEFTLDMYTQYLGDDLNSEIARRKWYFLYVAGLLTIAQQRAENNPVLWQPIAEIWVRLIAAAKDLRTTLSNTCIWNPDEIFFFNINEEDDDDMIAFVESALLPTALRSHPLLLEWKQSNSRSYQ